MNLSIHEQIAFLRRQKNMTQESLAQALGISNQAVSKWESGQCCPDISLLPELAALFEVSVDELLGYRPVSQEDDLILSLYRTAASLPEEKQDRFLLRTAAALHATALSEYMKQRPGVPQMVNMETVISKAGNTPWNYSCIDSPTIITVMRRNGVFFSDNSPLELSGADFSKTASLLKCFTDEKALRVAAALYELTTPSEELACTVSQLSAASGLPEEVVTVCLQAVLSALLEETQQNGEPAYRFQGKYRHILPLLSLLSYEG